MKPSISKGGWNESRVRKNYGNSFTLAKEGVDKNVGTNLEKKGLN